LVPADYQRNRPWSAANGSDPGTQEYEILVLEAEEKRWQLEVELFKRSPAGG
jgi:hypothetical protein